MSKKIKEYEKYLVNMTHNAENDLNGIVMFIAKNNPHNALKMLEKIQAKINALDHSPYRGTYVPELLAKSIKNYRQIIESPWKFIYKIDEDIVNILAILDSSRNLSDILVKKLLK